MLFRTETLVSLDVLYIGDKKLQLVGVLCLVEGPMNIKVQESFVLNQR